MYNEKTNVGAIVALCGGILAVISFFLFPYISLGFLGSYTAVQLTNGIFGSSMPSLWLELLVALVIIGLSAFELYNNSEVRASSRLILALSSITTLVIIGVYIVQSNQQSLFGSVSSFHTTSFWLYILGIITSLAGSILQVRR